MVKIPSLVIPAIKEYETISIPLPTADIPSYVPLFVPPSDLQTEEPIEADPNEEPDQPGIRKVDIPFTDIKWAVTALKPILKTAWKKLSKKKKDSLEK